jgi:phage host-nuclease inhibitor protein Gam
MILPKIAFKDLQEYCQTDKFEIVSYGEKKFSVITTPNAFLPFLKLEGYEMILTFIRRQGFDEEINIHADGLINGQK